MTTEPRPEYQHFVPQFLLRNFAHPYKGWKRRGKRKGDNGIYNNELVVHNLDLTADPPVLCEKPVKRIFGQLNMYEDTSKPSPQQRHIEERLGKLENQASTIFRKITKAYDNWAPQNDSSGVWLTRDERNILRKFLFILKYRGSIFHRRFAHETAEQYSSNDRELMQEYMKEKGYERPIDVWFDGLKAIMDQDLDVDRNWRGEVLEKMFPFDAIWFFYHMMHYYMTICTPLDSSEEFLLADCSYGAFEGPNCFGRNPQSKEIEETVHTPLHYFAPISPKLMLVLRSSIFPNPLEDADEDVREYREFNRWAAFDRYYGTVPGGKMGTLHDLPVGKAQNSYTKIVDGQVVWQLGEDGRLSKADKFFFPFFPIGSKHVNTINSVFLDNLSICTSIVFNSEAAFAKTIEWFLTSPGVANILLMAPDDGREESIRKIEQISRSLGSTKDTIRGTVVPPPIREGFMEDHTAKERRIMKLLLKRGNGDEALPEDGVFDSSDFESSEWRAANDSEFMTLYAKLVSHLVDPAKLSRLINNVAQVDTWIKRGTWKNIWQPLTPDSDGQQRFYFIQVAIHDQGFIRECGIPEIERLAQVAQLQIIRNASYRESIDVGNEWQGILEEREIIELWTRSRVRARFKPALAGKVEASLLDRLEKVFFEMAYPTPS